MQTKLLVAAVWTIALLKAMMVASAGGGGCGFYTFLQVELKTANAMPLLRYSCSSRIISLPTAQLNARRCVTCSACHRGWMHAARKASCQRLLSEVRGGELD